MPTADELIIKAGVDATGVTRGFNAITQAAKGVAGDVARAAEQIGRVDIGAGSAQRLNAELRESVALLGRMAGGMAMGAVDAGDLTAMRALVAEQHRLAKATDGAELETRQLAEAYYQLSRANVQQAAAALSPSGRRQQEELRAAQERGRAVIAAAAQEASAAAAARRAADERAGATVRAASEEIAARAQVRRELVTEIGTLRLLGQATDARSARAVASWRSEAAAIRQQAVEVGLGRREMLRLDATIRQTEQSFARQATAAQRSAVSVRAVGGAAATAGAGIGGLTKASGEWSSRGQRAASTAVAFGFGLEAIAREGSAADAGVRTALRSVASFAAFLGPKGLVVAGAAAGLAAILDLFSQARDEARDTAQTFRDEFGDLVNAGDFLGLQKKARDLFVGSPAAGRGEFSGYFKDGIGELRAQLAKAEADVERFSKSITTGGNARAAKAEVDRLTAALAPLEAQYEALTQSLRNPVARPRPLTGLPAVEITAPGPEARRRAAKEAVDAAEQAFREFVTRAEATAVRVQLLIDAGASQRAIDAALRDLRSQYEDVTQRLAGATLPLEDANTLLRTQIGLARELGEAYDRANRAAIVAPPPGGYSSAPSATLEIPAGVEDSVARMVAALRDGSAESARFASALGKIGTAGRGIANATRLVRGLGQELRDSVDGALGVVEAVEELARVRAATQAAAAARMENPFDASTFPTESLSQIPALIAGIGGAASLISGVIGGLFDNSAEEALRVAIDKNRDALDRLSQRVDRTSTLRGSVDFSRTLAQLFERRREFDFDVGRFGRTFDPGGVLGASKGAVGPFLGDDNFNRIARELGTSLAEVEREASKLGIDLRDGEGRLMTEALAQFAEALEIARQNALTLTDSFSDLQRAQSVRADLFNLESPADAWNDAVALAGQLLPQHVADALASFNITDAAGRALATDYLQGLFEQASSGQLADVLLASGFENIGEFFDFLLLAEDPLDQLAKAAGDAADVLGDLSLPPGFKKGLYEQLAAAPIGPVVPIATYTPPTPPTPPVPPTRRTDSPGDGRDRVTVEDYSTTHITIVGTGKTPEQLYDELEDVRRTRQRAHAGRLAVTRTANHR